MKNIFPETSKRVQRHTCHNSNMQIRENTINCIIAYKDSSEEALTERINCLDYEWDTERVLETNAASIVLASSVLGFMKSKKFFLLTGAVGLFLLQHALQGWCPPLPLIRKLGIRTAEEIENEKTVLKILRGDYDQILNNIYEADVIDSDVIDSAVNEADAIKPTINETDIIKSAVNEADVIEFAVNEADTVETNVSELM